VSAQVSIVHAEHINLAGLLFAGFLRKQLNSPKLARKASRIRGAFGVRVGRMEITLTFTADGIQISKGIAPKTRARIGGAMEEMIALVSGSGSTIGAIIAVLEGRITIRGNPFALLRLLPIMLNKTKTTPLANTNSPASSPPHSPTHSAQPSPPHSAQPIIPGNGTSA
jgi:hypothetical protein